MDNCRLNLDFLEVSNIRAGSNRPGRYSFS